VGKLIVIIIVSIKGRGLRGIGFAEDLGFPLKYILK